MQFLMYAIKRRGTEEYIPYTYPGDGVRTVREPTKEVVPALFINPAAAKKSISLWLQGVRSKKVITTKVDGAWVFSFAEVPHRKAEDLEIVEVTCTVTGVVDG